MHETSCDVTGWLMVTTTVILAVLVAVLLGLCMLGRLSRRHIAYSMATRVFFQACFTLFLPFMSYTFSQTKSKPGADSKRRAELVILWMLLVELLRKKVSAGIAPAAEAFTRGIGRYNLLYPVEEVVRMAWIGYLICAYVHGGGIKPYFISLWIFGVTTLCKRAICIHIASSAFDLAKNAGLVTGYMAQIVQSGRQSVDHENLMRSCNYVVMGESYLKNHLTPRGLLIREEDMKKVVVDDFPPNGEQEPNKFKLVRVRDIWDLAESDPVFQLSDNMRRKLEDICLALALFKLLRRKMEGYPMAEADTRQARDFVLHGLLALEGGTGMDAAADDAGRALEVVELELRFLNEYYQDTIPMALPILKLFVTNFALSIIFILLYGITVLLVTNNANIITAVGSLIKGLVSLFISLLVHQHHKCFLHQVASFVATVRTTFDIIITYLLMLTLLLVQIYQLVHYVLSDWYVASLMCNYVQKPSMRIRRHIRQALRSILWVKHRSNTVIKVHQLNLLHLHPLHLPPWVWMLISRLLNRRIVGLSDTIVTTDIKVAIVKALKDVLAPLGGEDGGPHLSNGVAALGRHGFHDPVWACHHRMSTATVIVVWHIATSMFEIRDGQNHPLSPHGQAAVTLSRYCAYLVAYEPRLLPDDEAWTNKVSKDITAELKSSFRSGCTIVQRRERLSNIYLDDEEDDMSAMTKGVKLGKHLVGNTREMLEDERVWGMLLEFWAELLVYVARKPVGGPEAHAQALANGGEFITHIWAMLTHAGVHVPKNHQEDQVPSCNCHPV